MFEMFYNRRNTIIGPYLDLLPKFDTNFQYFNYLPSFWSTEIKNLFNTLPSSRFEFYKREQQLVAIERYIGEIESGLFFSCRQSNQVGQGLEGTKKQEV